MKIKVSIVILVVSALLTFSISSTAFSAKARPDLSVQSISGLPASVLRGGSFSITDSIANNGNKMSKGFTIRYYLSLDTIKSKKDIRLAGKRQVKSLNYQITSSDDAVNLTVPNKTPLNKYYLVACADDTKKIKESNEKNNCLASNTTINVLTSEQSSVKEKIRLAALSSTSLINSIINNLDYIVAQIIFNADCNNFSSSLSTKLIINNAPHLANAAGHLKLFYAGKLLSCQDLLNEVSTVHAAEVDGSGSIAGSEVDANFSGNFRITGDSGYLITQNSEFDIIFTDYFIVNGSGIINNIKFKETAYPDVSGDVVNVKVSTQEALNLLYRVLYGHQIASGDIARIVKDGHINAYSSDCSTIDINFNGTNLLSVSSPCVSPSNFTVNVDTGAIIE